MSSPRWDRLAADLHAAGHVVQVDKLPRGQVENEPAGYGSENLGMTIRVEAGVVQIRDGWWRKNPKVWIGWQAWLENGDSIVVRELQATKSRSAVVEFVTACASPVAPAVAR